MWRWAEQRPRFCLKVGPQDMVWVEVRRDWKGRRHYRSAVTQLPEGTIRLSPLEPNVLHPDEFQEHIRTVAGVSKPGRGAGHALVPALPRAVTLILPDCTVRLAVLHLQELPSKQQEREALIRWRLGQEQLLTLTGTKIFFQVIATSGCPGEGPHTILVVMVQEAVLQQYEAMCEAAGLLPRQIEVASLALFNMWIRTLRGLDRIASDFLWVNVADGGFTAFIFHQRDLVFIRTKPQGIGVLDQEDVMGSGSAWVERIIEECAASLYACQQQYPALAVTSLVLAGEEGARAEVRDTLENELGVSVKELTWKDIRHRGGNFRGDASSNVLCAMAGVA